MQGASAGHAHYSPFVPNTKAEAPDLVRAAERIESDLRALEELAASVGKMRLHTEKSIARAARELASALEQPEQLAEGLKQLAQAMAATQLRQQAALSSLAPVAERLQQKSARFGEYMQRFAALGEQARETTELMKAALRDGKTSGDGALREDVELRLEGLMNGAKSLADSAEEDDFTEIARDADALRQRIQSLRGRLKPS